MNESTYFSILPWAFIAFLAIRWLIADGEKMRIDAERDRQAWLEQERAEELEKHKSITSIDKSVAKIMATRREKLRKSKQHEL